MKELLLPMSRYNVWANGKFIDVLLKLDDETLDLEMISSFPTLRRTVYHMMSAEYLWLKRLQLIEQLVRPEDTFSGTFAEACRIWEEASRGLAAFVEKAPGDHALAHVFQYYNFQKESIKMPVAVALQHAFNHSSYHRGQLVTMLRQAGTTKIPGTDYWLYWNSVK